MAKLSKEDLLARVARSAEVAGWSVGSPGTSVHPFTLYLYRDQEALSVLLYIWNLSHGGKNRPLDEYRIQVTGVSSIEQHPEYKTLILGYWEEQDVFAAWDVNFHAGPTSYSPSFQIREQYLLEAVQNGFSVCLKDQGELAIAFTPPFFITYCRNLEGLHSAGNLAPEVDALMHIAKNGAIDEVDLSPLPPQRQRTVRTIEQNFRDSSFRRRVLSAYGHACAVCGMQLQLVDAAHIIPVYDPQSNDETSNGLCLCALHHRALDRSLISVAPDYRILVNETEIKRLAQEGRGDGASLLRGNLAKVIRTPVEKLLRPSPKYLEVALKIRNWPS